MTGNAATLPARAFARHRFLGIAAIRGKPSAALQQSL